VALPMDEQRILEEMERMLAADDPRLAARLAAFGQPSVVQVLRTRRARAALSLLMLAVIAAAAAVIYLVSAFRLGSTGPSVPHGQQTSQRASTKSEQRTVPLPATVHCLTQIAPRTCVAWSSGAGGAQSPARVPGVTAAQGTGAGQATQPPHATKP
jgi:Protein of unknown function (DUF3040)